MKTLQKTKPIVSWRDRYVNSVCAVCGKKVGNIDKVFYTDPCIVVISAEEINLYHRECCKEHKKEIFNKDNMCVRVVRSWAGQKSRDVVLLPQHKTFELTKTNKGYALSYSNKNIQEIICNQIN